MNDTPVAIVLLLLLGAAVWVVRQAKSGAAMAPDPGAPSGQQFVPLSPTCVEPAKRWLLLPSQEV